MQDLRQIQETKLAVSPGLECSIVLVGLDLSSAQDYQQKGQISGKLRRERRGDGRGRFRSQIEIK